MAILARPWRAAAPRRRSCLDSDTAGAKLAVSRAESRSGRWFSRAIDLLEWHEIRCTGPRAMRRRPRILIVDDELGVRESLRAILEPEYEVLTASSGNEALACCRRGPVDLVTLDLRMPGLGGIPVLEAIKKLDPEIEVLIITGYGSFDTAVAGLRHHAFDYLSKPFEAAHVRQVVQAALARRFAMRRLREAPEGLLAALSHEFRTPLNVIIGYSSMLGEDPEAPLSSEQALALDRIQANSSALLNYVETLFYMVELDRGNVPVETAACNLATVMLEVQRDVAPQAAMRGTRLVVAAPADLTVTTDGDKLRRLLQALAENAVRHAGGEEVRLSAHPEGERIVVEVRDNGGGMTAEVTAELDGVVEGIPGTQPPRLLGFGLRLVGRLVRLLGLGLQLDTGPHGTVIRVAVPRQARLAAELAETA